MTQNKMDLQAELDRFLEMISPKLKLKVSWHIFNHIFETNFVLKTIIRNSPLLNIKKVDGEGSDIVSQFVRRLMLRLDKPEDHIIFQDDETYDIYFIAQGQVKVSIADTQYS